MTTRSGFTRWATALTLSLLFVAAGCEGGDSVLGVNEGRVRFSLSSSSALDGAPQGSAPASSVGQGDNTVLMPDGGKDDDDDDGRRALQSANVTMSSILARNLDGILVNVDMELPVTVDILSMDGPTPVMLPDAILPPDTYDQVVVVMRQVEVVTWDGTKIAITPPGGGWTAVVPICPFVVEEGETTTVGLTFMLRNAFRWREGRFTFRPRFVCKQE
jgi:Domain of unknown function (DUF4382)